MLHISNPPSSTPLLVSMNSNITYYMPFLQCSAGVKIRVNRWQKVKVKIRVNYFRIFLFRKKCFAFYFCESECGVWEVKVCLISRIYVSSWENISFHSLEREIFQASHLFHYAWKFNIFLRSQSHTSAAYMFDFLNLKRRKRAEGNPQNVH